MRRFFRFFLRVFSLSSRKHATGNEFVYYQIPKPDYEITIGIKEGRVVNIFWTGLEQHVVNPKESYGLKYKVIQLLRDAIKFMG